MERVVAAGQTIPWQGQYWRPASLLAEKVMPVAEAQVVECLVGGLRFVSRQLMRQDFRLRRRLAEGGVSALNPSWKPLAWPWERLGVLVRRQRVGQQLGVVVAWQVNRLRPLSGIESSKSGRPAVHRHPGWYLMDGRYRRNSSSRECLVIQRENEKTESHTTPPARC